MLIGRSLGPYRIVEQIGAGAMGEVYRAQDTRLGRDVAIKVLPADLAGKPERLARFEREARAAAALNHPHIATVYDVGCETLADTADAGAGPPDGERQSRRQPIELHFIVQEYLQGETLRRRLDRRPLGVEEALRVGGEIAGALAAAHEAGIVHRDLKPDNVFLSGAGHTKVLDFGLAKLVAAGEMISGESSQSITVPDSVSGGILGTPGYMAPEQVNGEPSDRRSDVFSFGAMLYEMVSGKRAFAGRSAADSLARVVHEEPRALEEIDGAMPLELSRIIAKCLQKESQRRYQTADDLAIDLAALRTAVESGTAVPVSAAADALHRAGPALDRPGWPALALTALLVAVGTWTLVPDADPPTAPVLRFSVSLPEGVGITRSERPVVAMSSDGQKVVVAANRALWLRNLGNDAFVRVAGSDPSTRGGYAVAPSFSPDGANVAFFLEGAIRRVALAGGAPISLSTAHIPSGIHWAADGYVYYTQGRAVAGTSRAFASESIWRVPEEGGTPSVVVEVDEDRRAAAPQLLPGGEWLLFSTTSASEFVMDESSREEIAVQSVRTGERHTLIDSGFGGRYVETGHILYLEGTSLWAVPFNLDGLEVTGGATQLIESVPLSYWAGTPYMGIADTGNIAVPALALLQQRNGELSWVRGDGDVEPLDVSLADNPRLSRDGTKVVAEVRDVSSTRIFVHEIDRSSWTELTPESSGAAPVWSPDGRWIYYMSSDVDGAAVWRKSADFTSPPELVWRPQDHLAYPESMPEDGRFLVYSAGLGDQNDIWLLWLKGERRARALIESPAISEEGPQVHPTGRWIAYTSNETGRYEIYVHELSEQGALGRRSVISTLGGAEPMWSRDGRTLFYRVGTQLIAVACDLDDGFRAGEPRVVMREFPGDTPVLRADYDVAPDGRFLTSLPQAEWSAQRLDIVINWFAESGLRRTQ